MEVKKATVSILVMDLGTRESPQNMFCAYDPEKDRIIFFSTLHLRPLPNYFSQEPVKISIKRYGKIISEGTPELVGPNSEEYRLSGLQSIPGVKHTSSKLMSFNLNDGDIVTIEKSDWIHDENPLNTLATLRTVGTPIKKFHLSWEEVEKPFNRFFGEHYHFDTTTIVFESNPGGTYAKYF